ncbi:MAG: HupE/UreJ family protein [Acidobacteriota bacterium]
MSAGRTLPAARATLSASLLLLSIAAPLSAHEIGTIRVRAEFQKGGTYSISMVADPETLLPRLELAANQPLSGSHPAPVNQQKIEALQQTFLDHVTIRFNGVQVTPKFQYAPLLNGAAYSTSGQAATIRLTGDVPRKATSFTWSYSLIYSTYALLTRQPGQSEPAQQWLEGEQESKPVLLNKASVPPTRLQVARQYLVLGYTHIVPKGLDHILFVLGIFLLNTRIRSILAQVTAFTVAHSITLGLTIYGVVSLSPRIVEPLIALSIAYVAIENLTTSELKPWRIAIVFVFGLLHGMGFAGVLRDLGLPRSEFLTALVTFNIGVEAGQLSVIAVASLLVARWFNDRVWYRRHIVIPASLVIAITGLYWTVTRIVGA